MRLLVVVLLLAFGGTAAAHDLRPGVVSLVERADGHHTLRFVPPLDSRGEALELTLVVPEGCVRERDLLRCEHGLGGELGVLGMQGGAMKTIVVLQRLDGAHHEWILTAARPRIALDAAPPRAALPWIRIGVEHILGGPDHLAFVLGLLLVLQVAFDRRLLFTITAFTVAHSLTLALSALRIVDVPIAPVEACIAASVLLVAREATHTDPIFASSTAPSAGRPRELRTMVRRWPWLAAAGFGLLHGLGFAAALGEIGLPRGALAWSLVWFNVGVELGQLAVVGGVLAGVTLWRRLVGERWIVGAHVHRTVCYLLGALAAWWLLDRVADLLR